MLKIFWFVHFLMHSLIKIWHVKTKVIRNLINDTCQFLIDNVKKECVPYISQSSFNSVICIDCEEKLKSALFIVGEIGGNDYNYALLEGKTVRGVMSMVPDVVKAIKDAVKVCMCYH